MGLSDLDTCQPHVSFYDYFTGLPIVDPLTGKNSLDIPYQNLQLVDQFYQTKKNLIGTLHIEFPNLIVQPEYRGLLHAILRDSNEIDKVPRVEVYAHQPDCGDPIWTGYVVPGGITEKAGVVTVDCEDSMTLGKWQLLDKIEEFNTPATGLYSRALSDWVDIVNEDFSSPLVVPTKYIVAENYTFTFAFPSVSNVSSCIGTDVFNNTLEIYSPFLTTITAGDTYLMEADITIPWDASGARGHTSVVQLGIADPIVSQGMSSFASNNYIRVSLSEEFNPNGSNVVISSISVNPHGFGTSLGIFGTFSNTTTQASDIGLVPNPLSGRFQVLLKFDVSGVLTITCFLDKQLLYPPVSVPYNANTISSFGPLAFFVHIETSGTPNNQQVGVTKWRCRKLTPWMLRASRFNPQTTDAVYYLSNNEQCFNFLQLICEKDGTEYRLIPRHGNGLDLLELDALNTLGLDQSQLLGFGQPTPSSNNLEEQSGTVSPHTGAATAAQYSDVQYTTPPPFRFEEGYNLSDHPSIQTKADAFANEVTRTGASSLDAQTFSDVWSVMDTGNPVLGIAPLRPYIEVVTNDDRATLTSMAKQMANYDLTRRLDPTPSLTLKIAEQLIYAWKWRAGDRVFVKTRSLLTNIEQVLRVTQVKHEAGNPEKEVTLGYQPWDQETTSFLADNAVQSWLFDQSGTSGLTFVYPVQNTLTIASGATSFAMPFSLDQFNAGSIIISATIHWTVDGTNAVDVLSISPLIDGSAVNPFNPEKNSKDSGPQPCTGSISKLGSHTLSFKNGSPSSTNLTGAFLVLQMKL